MHHSSDRCKPFTGPAKRRPAGQDPLHRLGPRPVKDSPQNDDEEIHGWDSARPSRKPVILRMGADPVPHEDAIVEHPNGPIVDAQSNTPLTAANLLEVQRGMERKLAPNLIILSGENAGLD